MGDQNLALVAYGDESIQRQCEPSRYLLAATVYDRDSDPTFVLRRAKPSGAQKLHWYDLDLRRQAASLDVVSTVVQQTTIVAALPLDGVRIERARRKALEEIVRTLEAMGIGKLVLESRNPTHDKRDLELMVSMRRRGEALEFDLEHVPGRSEPLLWVPDQILGAYGEVITKGASSRWERAWKKVEANVIVREVSAK